MNGMAQDVYVMHECDLHGLRVMINYSWVEAVILLYNGLRVDM